MDASSGDSDGLSNGSSDGLSDGLRDLRLPSDFCLLLEDTSDS